MAAVCALHPIPHTGAQHHKDLFSVALGRTVRISGGTGQRSGPIGCNQPVIGFETALS